MRYLSKLGAMALIVMCASTLACKRPPQSAHSESGPGKQVGNLTSNPDINEQPATSPVEPISYDVSGIKISASVIPTIQSGRVYVRNGKKGFVYYTLDAQSAKDLVGLLDDAKNWWINTRAIADRVSLPAPHYHVVVRDKDGAKIGPTLSFEENSSICHIDSLRFALAKPAADRLKHIFSNMGDPRPDDGLEDRTRGNRKGVNTKALKKAGKKVTG